MVSTTPILKIVDQKKPFVLEIDASGVAIDAILSQEGRHVTLKAWSFHHPKEIGKCVSKNCMWSNMLLRLVGTIYTVLSLKCIQIIIHLCIFVFNLMYKEDKVDGLNWCNNFIWKLYKRWDNVVTNTLVRIMHSMSFTILNNSLLQEIKKVQVEDLHV